MKNGLGFTRKVIIAFTVFFVIPIIALGVLLYNNSKALLEQEQIKSNLKSLENVDTYYIGQMTDRVDGFLNTLAKEPDLDKVFDKKEITKRINQEWATSLKYYSDVTSIYLGSIDGEMALVPYDPLPADYDPRTRPWYKDADANAGKIIWTQPYLDAGSDGAVLSVAKQVRNPEGKTIGVISLDVSLKKLVQIVNTIKMGEKGYVVLLDKQGTAVAIQDAALVGKDIRNLDWVAKAYSSAKGSLPFTVNGQEVILSYMTDQKTGWKLIGIKPKAELAKDTEAMKGYMNKLFLMIAVWGVLACAGLAIFLRRLVFNPIREMVSLMARAESGDLSMAIEHKYKDEIAQLFYSFDHMIQGQKDILVQVLVSATKLDDSAEHSSAIAQKTSDTSKSQSFAMVELTKAIEDMSISINEVTGDMTEIAKNIQNVAHTMQDMGAAASDVAKNTVETSEAMGIVTESLREMELSIERININSASANTQGEKSVGIVMEGKKIVASTKLEMDSINHSMKDLTGVITDLGAAATQIGEIIEVIEDISDQTNLLSLNASIEAARAGEHGKGFAVVANAIGKLSEKSAESTKDIIKLIRHIQGTVENAVTTTVKNADRIEHGAELVTETESAFSEIYLAIEETTKLINQIALSTYEQAESSRAIIIATEKVNDLTMLVSATTQEQLATVEEIVHATEAVNTLTQNVTGNAEVQAANSQQITATSLTVNEMALEVSSMSEEVQTIADSVTGEAKDLVELVARFKL